MRSILGPTALLEPASVDTTRRFAEALPWETELSGGPADQPVNVEGQTPVPASPDRRTWRRPEIVSFTPASEAGGFEFFPGDGVSNLC
jgi:hypothetical protein